MKSFDLNNIWDIIEKNKKIIAVILIAFILLAFSPSLMNILVPGPEGVRTLNYGVQFQSGSVCKAASMDTLPSGFAWVSNQPSSMIIEHKKGSGEPGLGMWQDISWYYENDAGKVRSEVQRASLTADPLAGSTKTLQYYRYTQVSDTQVKIEKVVLTLVPAEFVIQISAVPGAGVYTWKNVNLWYAMDTVVWLNSYANSPPQDPEPLTNDTTKLSSASYRGAFPIYAWIDKYKDWVWTDANGNSRSNPPDSNAISFVQLDPSLQGRTIDLYTAPTQKYQLVLSSDILQNKQLLQDALKPNKLPDPRFAQTVYFYITLTNFGCYVKPTGALGGYSSHEDWYPSVYYKVRVVYALWGEYVYLWTKSAAQQVGYEPGEWENRSSSVEYHESPFSALMKGIGQWFNQNAFWIWLVVGLAVVVFILIIVPRRR